MLGKSVTYLATLPDLIASRIAGSSTSTSAGRVTVCHKNVPAIISKLTSVMGDAGINIESMDNKSRGDYAYSVLDTGSAITEDVTAKLSAIDGVIKVRVVK